MNIGSVKTYHAGAYKDLFHFLLYFCLITGAGLIVISFLWSGVLKK